MQIGERYVFFLNENGAFLNPTTLVPVSKKKVAAKKVLFPESEALSMDAGIEEIPVGNYLELIRKFIGKS